MKYTQLILSIFVLLLAISCKSAQQQAVPSAATDSPAPTVNVIATGKAKPSNSLPKAVIYKTNGDYAQNVCITLDAAHDGIVSYPDPSDLKRVCAPIELGNGWLLDRQGGIGQHTAFLKYTYSEYAALPKVPSLKQLTESIIPGARVTVFRVLPITASEAIANPELAKKYATE